MKNSIAKWLKKKEEATGLRTNGVTNDVLKSWGMSRNQWSRILKGKVPGLDEAIHIAKFFECRIEDLWPEAELKQPCEHAT